jgi:hypothetical protein
MTKDELLKLVTVLQAELEATNRQVEILSDALAESRREVAALKINAALDKKAENARELGLDYEPVPGNFIDALRFDVAMRDALTPPAQPAPVQEPVDEYGSMDFGFEIAGVAVTDGDKRLLALLTNALGNDHPAFDDLMALVLTARSKATPPAAAVQEGRDWSLLEATQESLREHMAEIKRLKAAQLAMPDAIIEAGESPDYRDGWNDCRQAMLEMMK